MAGLPGPSGKRSAKVASTSAIALRGQTAYARAAADTVARVVLQVAFLGRDARAARTPRHAIEAFHASIMIGRAHGNFDIFGNVGLSGIGLKQHTATRRHDASRPALLERVAQILALAQVQRLAHALAFLLAVGFLQRVGLFQTTATRNNVKCIVFHAVKRGTTVEFVIDHSFHGGHIFGNLAIEVNVLARLRLGDFNGLGEKELADLRSTRAIFRSTFKSHATHTGTFWASRSVHSSGGTHAKHGRTVTFFAGSKPGKTFSSQVRYTISPRIATLRKWSYRRRAVAELEENASHTPMHTPHFVHASRSITGAPASSNEIALAGHASWQRVQFAPCVRVQCSGIVRTFIAARIPL